MSLLKEGETGFRAIQLREPESDIGARQTGSLLDQSPVFALPGDVLPGSFRFSSVSTEKSM